MADIPEANPKPYSGQQTILRQSTHTNLTTARRFCKTIYSTTYHQLAITSHKKDTERVDCMFRVAHYLSLHRAQLRNEEKANKTRLLAAGWEVLGYVTNLFTVYCAQREIWSWQAMACLKWASRGQFVRPRRSLVGRGKPNSLNKGEMRSEYFQNTTIWALTLY